MRRRFLLAGLIGLTLLFNGGKAAANGPGGSSSDDPYRWTDYHGGFDQTEIWKRYPATLRAEGHGALIPEGEADGEGPSSSADLDREAVRHFLTTKSQGSYQPIRNEVLATASYSTVLGMLLYGFRALAPEGVSNQTGGLGGAFALDRVAQTFFGVVRNYYMIRNHPHDPLQEREVRYAKLKRHIDPTLWTTIEQRFVTARRSQFRRGEALHYLDIALAIPLQKQSFGSLREDAHERLHEALSELMAAATYESPDEARSEIAASVYGLIQGEGRRHLYLDGPPGVGKTRLVIELGKRLGIPVVHVPLARVSGAESLLGSREKPGLLLEALIGCPYRNAILFFDEADRAFNDPEVFPSLKVLLEPEYGRFEPAFLRGAQIDLSGYLVIAAANHPVKEPALASRFVPVEFPSFRPGFIAERGWEWVEHHIKDYPAWESVDDFSDSEQQALREELAGVKSVRELGQKLPRLLWELSHEDGGSAAGAAADDLAPGTVQVDA